MKLTVVRHGETQYNVEGRYTGSTDVPLTAAGIRQATALGEALAGRKFDAIVSSPLIRAQKTAEIICGFAPAPLFIIEEFAEICVGTYEGLTRDEAARRYPEAWAAGKDRPPSFAPPGGESAIGFDARIRRGLGRLRAAHSDAESVLLVCHGFTARMINRILRGLSFEEMHNFVLGNCQTAEFDLD